jgi:hypothetical protein
MRVYKLVRKDYSGEEVFGYPNSEIINFNTNINSVLNKKFETIKPWTHCIPYYKNSHFAFLSLSALNTFLFEDDYDFSEDELYELNEYFEIKSFELSIWSAGLSKFLCTYFNDEVIEGTEITYSIKDISEMSYDYVYQDDVPKGEITEIKNKYYNGVITYYY